MSPLQWRHDITEERQTVFNHTWQNFWRESSPDVQSTPSPVKTEGFEVIESVTALALRQAQQSQDPALQGEALSWLWLCCPDIAEEMNLPGPPSSPRES